MAKNPARTLLVASLLLLLAVAWTHGEGTAIKVVLVGNSQIYYNQGLGRMLEKLALSGTPPLSLSATELAKPSAKLKTAWDYYESMGRLPEGEIHAVIIQDTLGFAILPAEKNIAGELADYAARISAWAKKHGSPLVVLLMEPSYLPPADAEIPIAEKIRIHEDLAGKLGAVVAPVGIAWIRAWKERPALKLIGPDGEHPSIAGSYLIGCMLYATLTGCTPVGLPYYAADVIAAGEKLGMEDAKFLQKVAWEECVKFPATGLQQ
jgi:hypothetical protein